MGDARDLKFLSTIDRRVDFFSPGFRQRSDYTGEIWKPSLFFLRLGLPSTLIRKENEAFRKRLSNSRNLKTPLFRFGVDGNHCENGAFRKRWRHHNHVISLTELSSNTNLISWWPAIVSSAGWTENIWCVFRVEPPFSNSSGGVWTLAQIINSYWDSGDGSGIRR